MGHKYVKEEDIFSTSQNGTVPKPSAQEVSDNKYLRADGTWKNPPGGGGGGASEFADLDDVSFSNLQNGQIPKYNSTTQKWENANESGGGSYPSSVPIYLGSQVIVSGAKSTTSTRENIWLKYRDANPFPYPITVPAGYVIKYRLSAAGSTAEANQAICGINGVDLVNCGTTWTGNDNDYTNTVFSDLFSFSDLPSETAYKYGTTTDALNLYIKSSISGKRAYLNNITLHYYLVAV